MKQVLFSIVASAIAGHMAQRSVRHKLPRATAYVLGGAVVCATAVSAIIIAGALMFYNVLVACQVAVWAAAISAFGLLVAGFAIGAYAVSKGSRMILSQPSVPEEEQVLADLQVSEWASHAKKIAGAFMQGLQEQSASSAAKKEGREASDRQRAEAIKNWRRHERHHHDHESSDYAYH